MHSNQEFGNTNITNVYSTEMLQGLWPKIKPNAISAVVNQINLALIDI